MTGSNPVPPHAVVPQSRIERTLLVQIREARKVWFPTIEGSANLGYPMATREECQTFCVTEDEAPVCYALVPVTTFELFAGAVPPSRNELTAVEQKALDDFQREMKEVVIPEIAEAIHARTVAAAKSRLWFIGGHHG